MSAMVREEVHSARAYRVIPHVVLALVTLGILWYIKFHPMFDLMVYRSGAEAVIGRSGGVPLYDVRVSHFPFTYPPFAAYIFIPFTLIRAQLTMYLMVFVVGAICYWFSSVIYGYVQSRGRRLPLQEKLGKWGTISALTSVIWLCGPWWWTTTFGQINAVILMLVLADFIRPATRVPRGVLIGIAGGIKLTPLAFGLIFLARRDWKGIATLGASFGATVALGFVLNPQDAYTYWFKAVHDPARVGNINYVDNISIQGWLMHLGLRDTTLRITYYTVALLTVIAIGYLLYQLERRSMVLAQVGVTGLLMISISPISWGHHNVMFPLLIAALVLDGLPVFFSVLPAWLYKLGRVLTIFAGITLYIEPVQLGALLQGGTFDRMDYIAYHLLVIATLPILSLYSVTMLWCYAATRPEIRAESALTR